MNCIFVLSISLMVPPFDQRVYTSGLDGWTTIHLIQPLYANSKAIALALNLIFCIAFFSPLCVFVIDSQCLGMARSPSMKHFWIFPLPHSLALPSTPLSHSSGSRPSGHLAASFLLECFIANVQSSVTSLTNFLLYQRNYPP